MRMMDEIEQRDATIDRLKAKLREEKAEAQNAVDENHHFREILYAKVPSAKVIDRLHRELRQAKSEVARLTREVGS